MSFRRPCDRCHQKFLPVSSFNRLCDNCKQFSHKKAGKIISMKLKGRKGGRGTKYFFLNKYECPECHLKFRYSETYRTHLKTHKLKERIRWRDL
jgi:hypothetical protein